MIAQTIRYRYTGSILPEGALFRFQASDPDSSGRKVSMKKMEDRDGLSNSDWEEICNLLTDVGSAVRAAVRTAELLPISHKVVGFIGGDTIFQIDKVAEENLRDAFARWPDRYKPIQLFGEGLDETNTIVGNRTEKPKIAVLIDPIDGTRNIMYDKRSAWFIAAACVWKEERPTTDDIQASVLVELPPSKSGFSDVLSLVIGSPLGGRPF